MVQWSQTSYHNPSPNSCYISFYLLATSSLTLRLWHKPHYTSTTTMESLHNVAKMPTQESIPSTSGMKRRMSKVPRPVPDLGGGSTESVIQDDQHPAGEAIHGGPKQFLRFVLFIIYFWTSCCSYVSLSQSTQSTPFFARPKVRTHS